MENLKGRKVKGFKFKSDNLSYPSFMDHYIGEVGEIQIQTNVLVRVMFEDKVAWSYPLNQIKDHLVPDLEIGKEYEFSDDGECWEKPMELVGIIDHEYKYLVETTFDGGFDGYKQIREIKPKVKELTLEEIAEKFGCDVSEIREIKPKVKEITLEEIAEKFGCDVNEIKIKK